MHIHMLVESQLNVLAEIGKDVVDWVTRVSSWNLEVFGDCEESAVGMFEGVPQVYVNAFVGVQ